MATPSSDTEVKPAGQSSASQTPPRSGPGLMIGIIALAILFLGGTGAMVFGLLQDAVLTSQIRDIFIIFMAIESLVIGVALIVLIVQIAGLINLLRNEVKPILEATNETVNTLRGTTEFLSENLVEPVIKMNGYLAGLQRVLELFGIKRK